MSKVTRQDVGRVRAGRMAGITLDFPSPFLYEQHIRLPSFDQTYVAQKD